MTTYASNSSLSVVRQCERKYAYRYPLKVKPVERESHAMAFGSWWHLVRALDSHTRGLKHDSLVAPTPRLTTVDGGPFVDLHGGRADAGGLPAQMLKEVEGLPSGAAAFVVADLWWRTLSQEQTEGWLDWLGGATLPEALDELDARWRLHYRDALPSQRPLLVEAKWERQVGDTDLILVGRIDEVVHDLARGVTVVVDHKTHGSWPSESDAVLDLMDSQLHLYAWGVSSLLADTPYSVQALAYDRVRVKRPATPSLTKSGNLSKSTTDYDLWTYLRWVETGPTYERYKKAVTDDEREQARGVAADALGIPLDEVTDKQMWEYVDLTATLTEPDPKVVEALSAPEERDRFFRRHLSPVNVAVVKAHLRAAVAGYEHGNRVRAAVRAGEDVPRSPSKGCQWCDYLSVCRAEMFGSIAGDADPQTFGLQSLPQWPGR